MCNQPFLSSWALILEHQWLIALLLECRLGSENTLKGTVISYVPYVYMHVYLKYNVINATMVFSSIW